MHLHTLAAILCISPIRNAQVEVRACLSDFDNSLTLKQGFHIALGFIIANGSTTVPIGVRCAIVHDEFTASQSNHIYYDEHITFNLVLRHRVILICETGYLRYVTRRQLNCTRPTQRLIQSTASVYDVRAHDQHCSRKKLSDGLFIKNIYIKLRLHILCDLTNS